MSINWNWKDKIGELKVRRVFSGEIEEFSISIYEGNADLIFIYEFEENGVKKYTLFNFFCDLQHLKRCVVDETCFNEWQEIIFFKCDVKRCSFAREFFKVGITVSFNPNYKMIERKCEE